MWLVKGADGRHDEYVCASAEGGAFTWEPVGGLTSLELNEAFYTRQQADARFAGLVNGVQVAQGEVTIGMQDIPGHGDYALSADVVALVSSRLAEAKRYADAQDEFVAGRLRQDLAGGLASLSGSVDGRVGELSSAVNAKFATNAYLTGTFSENIRDWVSLQIGQSVTSLLKFREVFDGTFAELAEHVTLDERRVGDVYLIPGTMNGAQVYEEYVVKGVWSEADGAFRPTGQNSDFELLGTVDVAQMENYYTKREADMRFAPLSYVDGEFLKGADAAAAYAGLGDFRAVSSSLGEARSGLGALSAEWEAERAILCGRLNEVQQNLAEVMESYCLLSSCIGRRTVHHAGLSAIMPEHLIPEVTPESFSQPLNLIRHDQFFTVSTLSDFGSLSHDVTFRLPNPNSAAKPIPAGASVSYAITNPTDEARSLTVYSETDDPLAPDSVELLIPASSKQRTVLAAFTVLYTSGGKKGWVMLKDKTN